MYRLRTFADFVVLAIVSLALCALGLVLLLRPREALPQDPAAYSQVSGVLLSLKDASPRRATSFLFSIQGRPAQFVSAAPAIRTASKHWQVGSTIVSFYVLPSSSLSANPVPAFGIAAKGQLVRSLQDDIQFHNAGVSPWPAALPLAVGILGLTAVGVRARQVSVA